jgi:hypothetical protein
MGKKGGAEPRGGRTPKGHGLGLAAKQLAILGESPTGFPVLWGAGRGD